MLNVMTSLNLQAVRVQLIAPPPPLQTSSARDLAFLNEPDEMLVRRDRAAPRLRGVGW